MAAYFDQIFDLMVTIGKEEEFKAKIKQNPFLVQMKNNFRMTLLHIAARNGNIEICKFLIENGADPSFLGGVHGNQTALHYAAEKSYFFAIYLTLLTKSLTRGDLTPLLMQILEQALKSKLTEKLRHLMQLLPQVIPEKLAFVSEEIHESKKMLSFLEQRLPLLMQILPQITPEIFVSTLTQILKQANPGDFSSKFEPVLTHVQQLKSFNIQTISASALMPILEHTNDLQNFSLLLEQMSNKINLKSSISSIIHPDSPIFSPKSRNLDEDILATSPPPSPR